MSPGEGGAYAVLKTLREERKFSDVIIHLNWLPRLPCILATFYDGQSHPFSWKKSPALSPWRPSGRGQMQAGGCVCVGGGVGAALQSKRVFPALGAASPLAL